MLYAAEEAHNPLLPTTPDVVWSVVVLIIIGLAVGKYVVPKFLEIFDERTKRIEGGIERAEKAQEAANKTLDQYQERLDEARNEAAKIREDARAEGQAILAQLKEQAQAESERIVESGKKELEAQKRQIINELRAELGKNSIALAEKLIGHDLNSETKKAETVDRFISEIELAG